MLSSYIRKACSKYRAHPLFQMMNFGPRLGLGRGPAPNLQAAHARRVFPRPAPVTSPTSEPVTPPKRTTVRNRHIPVRPIGRARGRAHGSGIARHVSLRRASSKSMLHPKTVRTPAALKRVRTFQFLTRDVQDAFAAASPAALSEEDKAFLNGMQRLAVRDDLFYQLEDARRALDRAAELAPVRENIRQQKIMKLKEKEEEKIRQEAVKAKAEETELRDRERQRLQEEARRRTRWEPRSKNLHEDYVREAEKARLRHEEQLRDKEEQRRREMEQLRIEQERRRQEEQRRLQEEQRRVEAEQRRRLEEHRLRIEAENRLRELEARSQEQARQRELEIEQLRRALDEQNAHLHHVQQEQQFASLRERIEADRQRRLMEERLCQLQQEEELRRQQEHARMAEAEAERMRQAEAERAQQHQALSMYETKWEALRQDQVNITTIFFHEVPWPVFPEFMHQDQLTKEAVQGFLLHPLRRNIADKNPRDIIRHEILRWHPDKFNSRVLKKVFAEHVEPVKEIAGRVARILTQLLQEIEGQGS